MMVGIDVISLSKIKKGIYKPSQYLLSQIQGFNYGPGHARIGSIQKASRRDKRHEIPSEYGWRVETKYSHKKNKRFVEIVRDKILCIRTHAFCHKKQYFVELTYKTKYIGRPYRRKSVLVNEEYRKLCQIKIQYLLKRC